MDRVESVLKRKDYAYDRVKSGKETQALLNKNNYSFLILDLQLSSFSSIEILKFLKLSKRSVKVLLFVSDKKFLQEFNLDENRINKMGIIGTCYGNQSPDGIIGKIEQANHATSWKKTRLQGPSEAKSEVMVMDRDMTRIAIKDVLSSNTAVFDHYVKLGVNKYVKVVLQSESFPVELLKSFLDSGNEYLYFLTKDRSLYINYMNELSSVMISSEQIGASKTLKVVKNAADKYIEEIYTLGLRSDLVNEGKKLCQNIFNLVSKDKNLNEIFQSMEQLDPKNYSHSFLVTFYSMVICRHVDWIGPKALDTVALGCLLHDIGQLKLPPSLRESGGKNLSQNDLETYKQHPRMGADMLQHSHGVNEQVRQIIYQHHEWVNGSGYPNGLTGIKIYPLAKIVALADGFTEFLVESKLPPRQAIKAFLQNREKIIKYDSNLVRALVHGFI